LVLVGTKCDLKDDQRTVTKEMGEQQAKKFLNCKFFEASAQSRQNVKTVCPSFSLSSLLPPSGKCLRE